MKPDGGGGGNVGAVMQNFGGEVRRVKLEVIIGYMMSFKNIPG